MPHELVCITDDSAGIDSGIRIEPLWTEHRALGKTWLRVKLFAREMQELIGPRFVLMDLDCVVTGPLDELFQTDAEFVTMRAERKSIYNTGFYLLEAGARARVWETFHPVKSLARYKREGWGGQEQAWVSMVLGQGEQTWGLEHGILNYGRDILNGRMDPESGRVVFFPGPFDPSKVNAGWVEQHWR